MDWIKVMREMPLTMKKVTKFKGHEGESLYQGDVYYQGKKVGFLSEGDWGGPPILRIESKVAKDAVDKFFSAQPKVKVEFEGAELLECKYDEESFVGDILACALFSKDVEKEKKKGRFIFVLPDDRKYSFRHCGAPDIMAARLAMIKKYPNLIEL